MSNEAATKGTYRVETFYESYRSGKPCKRTEFLQMRWAIAERIRDANRIARFAYRDGRDIHNWVVIVSELVGGEWLPIDGRLFTCEMQPFPASCRHSP